MIYNKRSLSATRSTRKRAKYSRSTAARKIQAQYRRRRPALRQSKSLSVGSKMMTQKVGRWLQFAKGEDTTSGKQQSFYGYDLTFPTALVPTDPLLLNVPFENGFRQKSKIKLGGVRVQAIIENCYTVPIEFHYMVVQNTRPDPAQEWSALDNDFWILHGGQQDNSPDFISQQVTWDPGMAFNRIRQDKFKILMHTKKVLMPQATQHALKSAGLITHSTGSGPIQFDTDGLSTINEKNVLRIDRYLQMDKMMSFEKAINDKPYYPLHVLYWCTVRQPALFTVAASNDLFCVNARNTLFWNE